jgi:hypothetical protein
MVRLSQGTSILVDTAHRPAWRNPVILTLGALVLLAHLGLLQSMPVGLSAASHRSDATLKFVTRSITREPEPASAEPTPPRRATAIRPVTPRPKVPAPPEPITDNPPGQHLSGIEVADSSSETLAVADPQASPESQVIAPAESTSAIEPATERSIEPIAEPAAEPASQAASAAEPAEAVALAAPSAETLPQRPPRNKPPEFKVGTFSASVRLSYEVRSNKLPITLKGELLWQNLGDHYEARLGYSAFGLSRSQTSQGQITTNGLAPARFADRYRSEVAAHFNYPQGKVTFSANTADAPLLTGAQDRLSVLLQLGALVAGEPARFTPGTLLTIQTVGAREADVWLFTFEESESLNLPGGEVRGIKLVRNPRKPYDQKVEVWLAPQLGYLPARIRITDAGGDSVDQLWLASSALTSPP